MKFGMSAWGGCDMVNMYLNLSCSVLSHSFYLFYLYTLGYKELLSQLG